jgi:uncharacterized protein (DUF2342 family)
MVDWRLAERVAEAVAGGDGAGPPLAGGADLDAMAARACERVSAYARIEPSVPPPALEAVGRKEWARANLDTMGGTLEPLLERLGSGPLQSAGGVLIGVEAGGIVGFMGRHVLGQYELALLDPERPPRLLLVAPNLRAAWDTVREGGLVHAVAGPERKEIIDRLQATMALIEGHAEHVMDEAGAAVLPSLPKLRESLERRRREKPPLVKLLERLLGLDLKMRQYVIGKRFCDAVVRDWGIDGLNRAWSAPDQLPTLAELDDPAAWVRRTQVRSVTPGS